MTKDEELKLALEALENLEHSNFTRRRLDARIAIKQALAQPEQEPTCPECKVAVLYECVACSSNNYPPAAQRPWVGLTAEDVHNTEGYEETREMYRFALAIEAKLKVLNT